MGNETKFCAKCGASLKEGKAFCVKCGAPVEIPAAGKEQSYAAPDDAASGTAHTAPDEAPPAYAPPEPGAARRPSAGRNRLRTAESGDSDAIPDPAGQTRTFPEKHQKILSAQLHGRKGFFGNRVFCRIPFSVPSREFAHAIRS